MKGWGHMDYYLKHTIIQLNYDTQLHWCVTHSYSTLISGNDIQAIQTRLSELLHLERSPFQLASQVQRWILIFQTTCYIKQRWIPLNMSQVCTVLISHRMGVVSCSPFNRSHCPSWTWPWWRCLKLTLAW